MSDRITLEFPTADQIAEGKRLLSDLHAIEFEYTAAVAREATDGMVERYDAAMDAWFTWSEHHMEGVLRAAAERDALRAELDRIKTNGSLLERVRMAFEPGSGWCVHKLAHHLGGIPPKERKPLYNALSHLMREGEIERTGYGLYRSRTPLADAQATQ